MKTIHAVFHAHLDPVWLWPWQTGLDESISTCRSACDRLESNPDVYFAQGESWVYEQVCLVDPELFARIQALVRKGQWEIVGGTCVQPDCNFPSGFAMDRQLEMARGFFLSHFGSLPRSGFNPDSFGHSAAMPGILRRHGMDRYVFMRPSPAERALPARLFRWRGYDDGPEVIAFRIADVYNVQCDLEPLRNCIKDLPDGIEHSMVFLGMGDHGGGVTQTVIDFIRAHRNAVDGATVEFSTTERFFAAIEKDLQLLPVVTGELQLHAIGCYTVDRRTKSLLRKAEHRLDQAKTIVGLDSHVPGTAGALLHRAWAKVCFNHFHDALGGTCIPSAREQMHAQLGEALSIADETIQTSVRRLALPLPAQKVQQLVFVNCSEHAFDGYLEHEPWIIGAFTDQTLLLDEQDRELVYQRMDPEALVCSLCRIAFKIKIPPGKMSVFRLDLIGSGERVRGGSPNRIVKDTVRCANGNALCLGDGSCMDLSNLRVELPYLALIDDFTDTWSHDISRYNEGPGQLARWQKTLQGETGPVVDVLIQRGIIGWSPVQAEWRIYNTESFIELRLNVEWRETQKVLKMVIQTPENIVSREDGIMAGSLIRESDGVERPLQNWSLLRLSGDRKIGIVCPDTYALDVTRQRVRLTLLRSPFMAHHGPCNPDRLRRTVADRGEHTFIFRFLAGDGLQGSRLDTMALNLLQPPVIADVTKGMPRGEWW